MQTEVSKSHFKAHALKIMREIEEKGGEVIITDHGHPALVIKPYRKIKPAPLEVLRESVLEYQRPVDPVADEDWELA